MPEPASETPPRYLAPKSLALALAVFTPFAAYAYLAKATFRATASVLVSAPSGVELDVDPLEATERIQNALLPESSLEGGDANGVIRSVDARHFELSCSAPSADGVVTLCNDLARRAAERLPELLRGKLPARPATPEEATRQRNAEELVALLAAHPELTDAQRAREARDPKIAALRAEQAALEERLAPRKPLVSPRSPGTPDPLDPDAPSDAELSKARARLSEVTKELETRRAALSRVSTVKPSPELRARWQELVKSAADPVKTASVAAPAEAPLPLATVERAAARPSSPSDPNRPLLLLIGSLLGAVSGLGFIANAQRRPRTRAPQETLESMPLERGDEPTPDAAFELYEASPEFDEDPEEFEADPARAERSSYAALPPTAPRYGDPPTPARGRSERPLHDSSSPFRDDATLVRRARIIELNASQPTRNQEPPPALEELAPGAPARFPPSRITQTFGSPLPPATSSIPPGYSAAQALRRGSGTSYSYVSTPPKGIPRQTPNPPPISTPPPPRPISSVPASEAQSLRPQRVSDRPPGPRGPAPVPVPSRSIVSPHPAPRNWSPEPSLLPAKRRALADELFPHAVTQCFVIGVLGGRSAGEPTGRVAAELALALADSGHPRVLLLEGNLQRPTVQRWTRVAMPLFAGFSEQLEGRVQADRERGGWTVVACLPTLHVLAEGMMSMPELILSRQFEDAVSELRNYYDVIVISGPLLSEAAACRSLRDVVDGAVLVCPDAGSEELDEATALFTEKRFSTVLTA